MLVYSAIQIEQIHDAIRATAALNFDPWPSTCPSRMTADFLIRCASIPHSSSLRYSFRYNSASLHNLETFR